MADTPACAKRPASAGAKYSQRKKRVTTDQGSVEAILARVEALRCKTALSRDQSLDILHLYFSLVLETMMSNAKSGRHRPANAHERCAELLGRSRATVVKVVKQFTDNLPPDAADDSGGDAAGAASAADAVRVVKPGGNHLRKEARVPHADSVYFQVRDYVREMRLRKSRVTATQVLEFLVEKGIVTVEKDESGHYVKADH